MNRARHRSTVNSSTPRSAAACFFVRPPRRRSTISPRRQVLGGLRAPGPRDQPGPLRCSQDQFRFGGRGVRNPPARPAAGPRTGAATSTRVDRHPQPPRSAGIRHPPGAGRVVRARSARQRLAAPPGAPAQPAHHQTARSRRQKNPDRHSRKLAEITLQISGATTSAAAGNVRPPAGRLRCLTCFCAGDRLAVLLVPRAAAGKPGRKTAMRNRHARILAAGCAAALAATLGAARPWPRAPGPSTPAGPSPRRQAA